MKIQELNESLLIIQELEDIKRYEKEFSSMTESECLNYFNDDYLLNEGVKEWLISKGDKAIKWYNDQTDTIKYVAGLNSTPDKLQNFATQINKWNRHEITQIEKALIVFVEKVKQFLSSSNIGQKIQELLSALKEKADMVIIFIKEKFNILTSKKGWPKLIFSLGFSALLNKLKSIKTKVIEFMNTFSIENIANSIQNLEIIKSVFNSFESAKEKIIAAVTQSAGEISDTLVTSLGQLSGFSIFFQILSTMNDARAYVMAVLRKAQDKMLSLQTQNIPV